MINIAFAVIVLGLLFFLLILSVMAGRAYGRNQLIKNAENQLEVVIVAEGAVFTLLALLVAFAFSGAYERFESRKLHIIEEANAIDAAYKRLDLLAVDTQKNIKENFRRYVDSRLLIYKDAASLKAFRNDMAGSSEVEDTIWSEILTALKTTNDASATQLLIPAVNDMFDIENAGAALTRVHPPMAIFALLIGLAILSGFLAGYSTANSKSRISLHILSYVVITAITIYIIVDLEFPRIGLIRVDSFDKLLMIMRDRMH